MVTVYARLALNAPTENPHQRDFSRCEQTTVEATGATWDEARAALPIPAGAVVLAVAQWPI